MKALEATTAAVLESVTAWHTYSAHDLNALRRVPGLTTKRPSPRTTPTPAQPNTYLLRPTPWLASMQPSTSFASPVHQILFSQHRRQTEGRRGGLVVIRMGKCLGLVFIPTFVFEDDIDTFKDDVCRSVRYGFLLVY